MLGIVIAVILVSLLVCKILVNMDKETKTGYMYVIKKEKGEKQSKVYFREEGASAIKGLVCDSDMFTGLIMEKCYQITYRSGKIIKVDTDWRK